MAKEAGAYTFYAGNSKAAPAHYDLAGLPLEPGKVSISGATWEPRKANPDYRPPEELPDISALGAPLDVAGWHYRKTVTFSRAGVQQLELDTEVLAHASSRLADLRLVSEGRQIPYLIEHTSLTRSVAPQVALANDPKTPKLSRWKLKLEQPGLPLLQMTCAVRDALFQRSVVLYEERKDDGGQARRCVLGEATWIRTPDHLYKQFSLPIATSPQTDTVYLEIENGDNPPIKLENFQFSYPATRLLFKAPESKPTWLYYGNARAEAPRYDLGLISGQMFSAEKASATPGAGEEVKGALHATEITGMAGNVLFWGVLGLVVVVLLVVIVRLLPAPADDEAKKN